VSDLQARFAQAQQDVSALAERPDNNTMLKLYALYKQATEGDATGEQPGSFDFVRRAKFDAWSANQRDHCRRCTAALHRLGCLLAALTLFVLAHASEYLCMFQWKNGKNLISHSLKR
jgi:acyl-CoA-binding protein